MADGVGKQRNSIAYGEASYPKSYTTRCDRVDTSPWLGISGSRIRLFIPRTAITERRGDTRNEETNSPSWQPYSFLSFQQKAGEVPGSIGGYGRPTRHTIVFSLKKKAGPCANLGDREMDRRREEPRRTIEFRSESTRPALTRVIIETMRAVIIT